MSQRNKIPTHCLPHHWSGGAVDQAVTSSLLVSPHFKGGRDPAEAGGERLVGNNRVVYARVGLKVVCNCLWGQEQTTATPGHAALTTVKPLI